MSKPLSFQQVILRLQQFWSERGALIWQPYSEKVGAGTMNPATVLRVLGPEPWNVAYVEPSYRPDDGRYGDNPNRMQMHTQFQVILKPDPGNPQEIYLDSLYALGIRREEHDIRFVEDNWESPALGAWGLGWEVWLDGLEITQYTYFQQAGGIPLDPVPVEITYGLERITMFLQDVRSVWEIDWDGHLTYGNVLLQSEIEHCRYNFEVADVEHLTAMYALHEAEAERCLEAGLVVPAHDHVLRCSHTFNLLDARGAIGVTERATYFQRMRDQTRRVAEAYAAQREGMGYPWRERVWSLVGPQEEAPTGVAGTPTTEPETLVFEIGTEELPAADLSAALEQLHEMVPQRLEEARLAYDDLEIWGTPRRQVVWVEGVAPRQKGIEELVKGPPARVAFDDQGNPTRAAQGFAGKFGVSVDALEVREMDGGEYVVAVHRAEGRPSAEVLPDLLVGLLETLHFRRSMRWNESGVAFSRPLRWLVALLGRERIPLRYAGVESGRVSRGSRPEGSPALELERATDYPTLMARHDIVVDPQERRALILKGATVLAKAVGGRIPDDRALLDEVTHLVEQPTPLRGQFEEEFLELPAAVLTAVMKKHQRYFPVVDEAGALLPYFIAVRNGPAEHLESVRHGNEEVIRARFSDAQFFYREDIKQPLEAYLPRLETLTFQEELGSMLDKTERMEALVPPLAEMVALEEEALTVARRAAHLSKADLVTRMVIEFTSLQGIIGRIYALKSGEPPAVAEAILEHYLPRSADDELARSRAGLVVGLAHRLDSLMGLFAVGLTPTGSSDPYQLRREALGLVQNLIAHRQPFSVEAGLEAAAQLLPVSVAPEAVDAARHFVVERLRSYLREQGFGYDVVEAVLAERGADPFRAYQSVGELARWIQREDWPRILDNYARCVRITRDVDEPLALDPARFVEAAERELYEAYQRAEAQVTPASGVEDFLAAFLPLVERIDYYFARESGVMVMAEEEALRRNRLAQLQRIAGLADGIVDLSKLEGF
jgi:glycyl-tRNA synthetase